MLNLNTLNLNTLNPNTLNFNMLKLIKYVKSYYGAFALASLSCVGASVARVLLTDLLKDMVDNLSLENLHWKIWTTAGRMLLIILLGIISNYLIVRMMGTISSGLLKDLRADCIDGLMKASPDYMSSHNYGDVMERVSSDVEGLAGFMQGYFTDCLYVPIMLVVYSVYLLRTNVLLAVCCLTPLAVLVPLNIKYMKPIKLRQFEYAKELGLTNNHIQTAFEGALVIKAYNLQKQMENNYYKALHKTYDISNDTDLRQYHLEPISRAVQEIPIAVALGLGGLFIFKGIISIGTLIAYITIIKKLVDPLAQSCQLVVRSQTALVSVSRVFDIIETPSEPSFTHRQTAFDRECPILEFQDVSFAYGTDTQNSDVGVLEHISFSIKKGTKTAFVGKSGGGKSTILKLLARQIEASAGTIRYFGQAYAEIAPRQIRAKEGLVSQDDILFPISVADNIRIGNPVATRGQIVNAVRMANCEEFINALPNGLDTVLEERGNNLSGGQRQRIALARALVKDAEIYLFDEPTSALDSETEQLICKSIDSLPSDKTVVTVAHRLSTVKDYDCIYVIDKGRIVEQGTHDALIRNGRAYYQMYQEFCKGGNDA